MKWRKRTAAALASLLLLSTVAQAREPVKASPSSTGASALIHAAPARQETEVRKITVIPVVPVFSDLTEEPDGAKTSAARVLSEPTAETASAASAVSAQKTEKAPASSASPNSEKKAEAKNTPVLPEKELEPQPDLSFPEAEDWQLLLVNPWNEMPEDYEVNLKTLSNGLKIDEKAYDDLSAMLQACREDGLSPQICSAYRTHAKQTSLYNNKVARLRNAGYSKTEALKEAGRWVARPGTSEHQLGLALDIVSSSYQALTKKQEHTAEQKWLMEHCWEYGFILRYPNDKSEITGIGYEPWHYRYVGVEVAQDIRKSGLCFEEYLLLREETLAAKK